LFKVIDNFTVLFQEEKTKSMRFKILVIFILSCSSPGVAQYNAGGTEFYIGPKVNVNGVRYTAAKNSLNVPEAHKFPIGYGAGFMYKFKVNDLLSLHGEFIYAKKTRSVIDSTIITKFKNQHIDAPILFEISFPAKNKYIGKFEYFFNAGAQISYWLSGKGTTTIPGDSQNLVVDYPVDFNRSNSAVNNKKGFNKFQYGFVLGAGLTLPSVGDNFFVIEARYNFCQTYLGYQNEISNGDFNYTDDLRGNYQVISVSFGYTFGLNFRPNSQKSGTKIKTVVQ